MTLHLLAELATKSFLISGIGLLQLLVLKQRSAAERSWIAHAALLVLLALPVASLALPRWRLLTPVTLVSSPPAGQPATFELPSIVMVIYAVGAGFLLLGTLVATLRLFVLQRRATVVTDAYWLTALARAQQRLGIRHGAALLVNGTVSSPLSWGLMRPVILLDEGILSRPDSAEAVITHELAHVAHLDWLKLLAAHIATAVFWFNPLVWMLVRQSHQLREEAADDAVLTADISAPDYAGLLVDAARHENRALFSAAHGVAPGKHSLRQRVLRVLDRNSSRKAVSAPWALTGLACLALLATPLTAVTLERAVLIRPFASGPFPLPSTASVGAVAGRATPDATILLQPIRTDTVPPLRPTTARRRLSQAPTWQPERVEQPERPEKPEQAERPEIPERPERAEQP